jgi:hypothetical protein
MLISMISYIKRVELQVMDYQTQAYRLLPGLASTYALVFATTNLRNIVLAAQTHSDNFKSIKASELATVPYLTLYTNILS